VRKKTLRTVHSGTEKHQHSRQTHCRQRQQYMYGAISSDHRACWQSTALYALPVLLRVQLRAPSRDASCS
jgi:hypothetical protein